MMDSFDVSLAQQSSATERRENEFEDEGTLKHRMKTPEASRLRGHLSQQIQHPLSQTLISQHDIELAGGGDLFQDHNPLIAWFCFSR